MWPQLVVCPEGSPPYTWGALKSTLTNNINAGITPIYMGSTINHPFFGYRIKDHPHIHGEHC